MSERQNYTVFQVAGGFVALAWNSHGISGLRLPDQTEHAARQALLRRMPDALRTSPDAEIASVIDNITRYFAGETVDFSNVPVDFGDQEPFFLQVYDHIRKLGRGQTTTYGDIARALGVGPEAARDVGKAMAGNPVPLIVPCHRVLAAGGRIGGFSAPGGPMSKMKMLEIEGATVTPPQKLQKPPSDQTAFDF